MFTFDRDTMLLHHLTHNHYPPVPQAFKCAVEALDAFENDEADRLITVPSGKRLEAREVVEQLHLDWFLSSDDFAEEWE
jgi:hypothetical protein